MVLLYVTSGPGPIRPRSYQAEHKQCALVVSTSWSIRCSASETQSPARTECARTAQTMAANGVMFWSTLHAVRPICFGYFFLFFLINLYIYLDLCLVDFALETWRRSVCSLAQQLLQAPCACRSEHNMSHGANTDRLTWDRWGSS